MVPGSTTLTLTRPCVIKWNQAGAVQWQSDPGFEPTGIAVDDTASVYVKGPTGSARLDKTTGVLVPGGLRPGKGRLLAHPSNLTGTYQIEHFGPGGDVLNNSANQTRFTHDSAFASNASKEFYWVLSGIGGGRYNAAGSPMWVGAPNFQVSGKSISFSDVWIDDAGNTYYLGESNLRPGTSEGYLYKRRASDGQRLWVTMIGGCFTRVTGDNNGNVYCIGGDFSVGDSSNVLKLEDVGGNIVWGIDLGSGVIPRDIAADSFGNVAVCGRTGSVNVNTWYINGGGAVVWSANHHPHNPTGGGAECWAVCFDAAGNVYATGGRI